MNNSEPVVILLEPDEIQQKEAVIDDEHKVESNNAYAQLLALDFPAPFMNDQRRLSLTSGPAKNNFYPLIEERPKSGNVSLKPEVIKQYESWLVIGDSGGICKACKLFIPCFQIPQNHGKFLSKPWKTYSREKDLENHQSTTYHQEAYLRMQGFISSTSGLQAPVTQQLNSHVRKDIQQRRKRLSSIVKGLVFCARAGIALRGHRNEHIPLTNSDNRDVISATPNRGNFMATLDLMRTSGDTNIDIYINNKASYTSHQIQNELLIRLSDHVIHQVVADVNKFKMYSIIADKTRDASNTEQLCLAVRYFDTDHCITKEKFVRFVALESLRGKNIFLLDGLTKFLATNSILHYDCQL